MSGFRSTLIAAIAVIAVGVARADDDADDPIDAKLTLCLQDKDNVSTMGMNDCMHAAIKQYDVVLNQTYQRAMAALDPASRDQLRVAQRAWLAYRDAEDKLASGKWRSDRGTIVSNALAARALSAIKERIADLRVYAGDED